MEIQRCTHGYRDLILLNRDDLDGLRQGDCFYEMGVIVTSRFFTFGSLLHRIRQFAVYVFALIRRIKFFSVRNYFDGDLIVIKLPDVLYLATPEIQAEWFELYFYFWPRHIECEVCRMVIKARMQREAIPTNPTQ